MVTAFTQKRVTKLAWTPTSVGVTLSERRPRRYEFNVVQ